MPAPRTELGPIVGRKKRLLTPQCEVVVELVGWVEDPVFTALVPVLRSISAELGPLMRLLTTSVSHCEAFATRHARDIAASCRGLDENSALHAAVRCYIRMDYKPLPWVAVDPGVVGRLASNTPATVLPSLFATAVRAFFMIEFVGWKLMRDAASFAPVTSQIDLGDRGTGSDGDVATFERCRTLIVRPYFTETSKRAGYMLASGVTRKAIVIDPSSLDVPFIVADAEALGVEITAVVRTHVAFDHLSGVHDLVRLVSAEGGSVVSIVDGSQRHSSGSPASARMMTVTETPELEGLLGPEFHFELLKSDDAFIPFYQPGDAASALRLIRRGASGETTLAVFTGVLLGTDCPGPVHATPPSVEEALAGTQFFAEVSQLHRVLRFVLGRCAEHSVVFPGYGGYSSVTHALNLAWVAHVYDMRRASAHLFAAIDNADPAALAEFHRALLPMARSPMGRQLADFNRRPTRARGVFDIRLPNEFSSLPLSHGELPPAESPAQVLPTLSTSLDDAFAGAAAGVQVLDVRVSPLHAHRARRQCWRLRHAICVPMGVASGASRDHFVAALKAELWTPFVLLPLQKIYLVVEKTEDLPYVLERLRFATGDGHRRVIAFATTASLNACSQSSVASEFFVDGSDIESFDEFDSTHRALEPAVAVCSRRGPAYAVSVVLDCRTPYEFRNGSHVTSVHLPLSDIRSAIAMAIRRGARAEPPEEEGDDALSAFEPAVPCTPDHLQAIADLYAPSHTSLIALYCAAGYRSFIAMSLLQAARSWLERVRIKTHSNSELACSPAGIAENVIGIRIGDVAKGALQIMTRHADHWVVKDRSVICIS
jgi:rhodanese-related sulfurtransferase